MKEPNPIRDAAVAAGFRITTQRARLVDCLREGKRYSGARGKGRTGLDAPFLRWLCATGSIAPFVHAHGLHVARSIIKGALDLDYVKCGFPIVFENCRLETCSARVADMLLLRFIGCELDKLAADNIRVHQSLMITQSQVHGGVLLRAANIASNLRLAKSRLGMGEDSALDLGSATIGGSIWMTEGFRADGPVLLHSTEAKRNIECDGLIVAPIADAALLMENCNIGGSVLLRRGFRCIGQVRILGANVEGGIDFQGARIAARRRQGLVLESSTVARGVIIRGNGLSPHQPFRCIGGVSLVRTFTAADVDFSNAVVLARGRPAANFRRLRCDGQFVCQGSKLRGSLVLAKSIVKSDVVLVGSRIEPGSGPAILAEGHNCGGSLSLVGTAAKGRVDFSNLIVGDDLLAMDSQLGGGPDDNARFTSARIRGAARFSKSVVAGSLNFYQSTIGTTLSFMDAMLSSLIVAQSTIGADLILIGAKLHGRDENSASVDLSGLRCSGSLVLDTVECNGKLDLDHAALGDLVGNRATIRNADKIAIDGTHVQINGQFQLTYGQIEGGLRLERMVVSAALDLSGTNIQQAEVALDLTEARIGGTLFLTRGFDTATGKVDLSYADAATIHDDPDHWPPKNALEIQGLTFRNIVPLDRKLRIDWLKRWRPVVAAGGDYSWQPYEQLMEILRRHGREADRQTLAIEKQRAASGAIASRPKRWLRAVYGATMRYGYRPQRAIFFAPLFIGISILAFHVGAATLMVPANEAANRQWAMNHSLPLGYPSFSPIFYSIDTFVPIISLQQRDAWRPDDRATCRPGPASCGMMLRVWLWMNVMIGWIVTTLVVAGFTGLIRKD